jgi:opacity protein-like surface antigen
MYNNNTSRLLKQALALAVMAAAAAPAPALPFSLSAGGGALLGYTFTRYTLEGETSGGGAVRSYQSMDRFDYGGFLFFDAAYGELAVMVQGGSSGYQEIMDKKSAGASWVRQNPGMERGAGTEASLGFSLLGKYPFQLTERITLFPLLGLEYHIALLEWRTPDGGAASDRTSGVLPEDRDKNDQPYPLHAWNSLWIDLGAGVDYQFTEKLYLRGEVLFGFRLPTAYENGAAEMIKSRYNAPNPSLGGLTGSPAFKIALGCRFFTLKG